MTQKNYGVLGKGKIGLVLQYFFLSFVCEGCHVLLASRGVDLGAGPVSLF